ncbi:MAG: sialidase family protein [Gemmatimonadota bacterium]
MGSGEPFLSTTEDAVYMSWLEPARPDGHDLWVARLDREGWRPPNRAAHGDRFFVNWADFPSVLAGPDGTLWAHWLQRTEGPGLAYGVRLTRSNDGGRSWAEAWTPHEDGSPTEHGFVSLFRYQDGIGVTWLDGRKFAEGPGGEPPNREMTLRFRHTDPGGRHGPEVLLDARTCDCCQTDAALTARGPVVVYRDRSHEEIRDIYIARLTDEGWSEGVPVHDDGWHIEGCPVNGPAVAARGQDVAVAWFTAASEQPRVYVAFSADAGATFGPPIRVDSGNPAGRVDLLMRDDRSVLVSWLERTGGEGADIRIRLVEATGAATREERVVTASSAERASGFPRMAPLPWDPGRILLAWTDVTDAGSPGVRLTEVEVER